MNRLIRYLKGYVHIRLISREPERFLNLCAHNRILLWRLVSRDGFYEMYLSAADFFRLHSLCRKSGSRIKVIGKYGLPFFLYRNRKRKAFFLGILLCMCLLYVLSLFLWNIHVSGNYANSTGTILAFLEQEGITHGILKAKLNCSEIAALLREEFSNITWVSAKIEGTQLILEVKENVDGYVAEEETPTEQCLSDKSEQDGQITPQCYAEISKNLSEWIGSKGYTKPGLTIRELSDTLHTNRTYLSAYIKTTYNMSFREWITGLRFEHAKQMLYEHPELTVAGISELSGFLSQSYFMKIFKEKEGSSPARWRKTQI